MSECTLASEVFEVFKKHDKVTVEEIIPIVFVLLANVRRQLPEGMRESFDGVLHYSVESLSLEDGEDDVN